MLEQYISSGLLPAGSFMLDDYDYRQYWKYEAGIIGFYGIRRFEREKLALPKIEHKHLAFPDLKLIITGDGSTKVTAILKWGKKNTRTIIESSQHERYQDALYEVYDQAQMIKHEIILEPWNALNKLLTIKQKHTKPLFKNVVNVGFPKYIAEVMVKGNKYVSSPFDTKISALHDLAKILNSHQKTVNSLEDGLHAKKKQSTKQIARNKEARALVKDTVARWRCEYSWLISYKHRSKEDLERSHDLSMFLAMFDPARQHEISQFMRRTLMPKVEEELNKTTYRMTDDGEKQYLTSYLKCLMKTDILLPNTKIVIDAKFNEKSYRNGEAPESVIDKLLGYGYLRLDFDEEPAITIKGIKLIESRLKSGLGKNSLGRQLSKETLFSLSKMKENDISK